MKTLPHRIAHVARALESVDVRGLYAQRIFSLDGGHVVLLPTPRDGALTAAEHLARQWTDRYVTVVVSVPRNAPERVAIEIARAARAFGRVILCEEGGPDGSVSARRLEDAARRVECQYMADPRRALRHCIDGMLAGDVIVYCCDALESALEILDEYGAEHVAQVSETRRAESVARIHTALNVTPGAKATAHSPRV
jgi:hypothetical protein